MLVRRHQAYLYRVARSFRLDEATCEDAVQTTWLRLIEHAGTLRDPDCVSTWLVTTLRRHVFSVFRSRGQAPELAGPAIAELPDPGRSPEQEVTAEDQNRQVSRGAAPAAVPGSDPPHPADGFAGAELPQAVGPAPHAGRQYRPEPGPQPGPAAP